MTNGFLSRTALGVLGGHTISTASEVARDMQVFPSCVEVRKVLDVIFHTSHLHETGRLQNVGFGENKGNPILGICEYYAAEQKPSTVVILLQ